MMDYIVQDREHEARSAVGLVWWSAVIWGFMFLIHSVFKGHWTKITQTKLSKSSPALSLLLPLPFSSGCPDLSLWEREAQHLGGLCTLSLFYLPCLYDGKGREEFGKTRSSAVRQIWGVSDWTFNIYVTLDKWLKLSEPQFSHVSKWKK